jgi:[protein-PII] uridylyltransferase
MSLQLGRMKRYGILGNYLPEFGRVIGQMQHDLFHIYTVDAHTLEVVRHMRRFFYPEEASRFPVVARVVKTLPKPELLYIAGLYHDVAKGRGGDHSTLGAVDARLFCERHGLGKRDTNLVVWLVEKHLFMSTVSQRKDISDPDVITQFALTVGDQSRLDYLYCLTVADINATNPKLWNNWRDSLLRQLYAGTKRALIRGLENPIDRQDWIDDNQQNALQKLLALGAEERAIKALWQGTGDDYFLRESIDDIVWHTQAITRSKTDVKNREKTLVLIRSTHDDDLEVATQIFVYTKNRNFLFAVLTSAMEQLDLSIQDARIYTSSDDYILDTFYVLNADGKPIGEDHRRFEHIKQFLEKQLEDPNRIPELVNKRTPRKFRLFTIPTDAQISVDYNKGCSVLEVITPDRPGLLARIGKIFFKFQIHLQNAKISTLGERVEDVFFITDQNEQAIEDPALQQQIIQAIRQELDGAVNPTPH